MKRQELISDAYLAENRRLHDTPRGFGHSGRKHAGEVLAVASLLDIQTILDYGCGGGTLKTAMQAQGWVYPIYEYDPAVPGKDAMPEPAEMVVCTDVLEHVEPEYLDRVLTHLNDCTFRVAFLSISTVESSKHLRDGRNAHLIVESAEWWADHIQRHNFRIRSRFIRTSDKTGEVRPVEVSFWLR